MPDLQDHELRIRDLERKVIEQRFLTKTLEAKITELMPKLDSLLARTNVSKQVETALTTAAEKKWTRNEKVFGIAVGVGMLATTLVNMIANLAR